MWATVMGLLIQMLSARLVVTTERHLAELCREEYPRLAGMLLGVMAELAMFRADIQEVIRSAIAIKVLSGGVVPLWGGVVITALDCFVFLFLENYSVRKLKDFFGVLIARMAVSYKIMFGETKPNGKGHLIGVLVPKLSSRNQQWRIHSSGPCQGDRVWMIGLDSGFKCNNGSWRMLQ